MGRLIKSVYYKKEISNLGKALNKERQRQINGGSVQCERHSNCGQIKYGKYTSCCVNNLCVSNNYKAGACPQYSLVGIKLP